jgi:hypothetical protein
VGGWLAIDAPTGEQAELSSVPQPHGFAGVAQWLESQPSKLAMRVRFPSPAPTKALVRAFSGQGFFAPRTHVPFLCPFRSGNSGHIGSTTVGSGLVGNVERRT